LQLIDHLETAIMLKSEYLDPEEALDRGSWFV
jgi:hypothetical protein